MADIIAVGGANNFTSAAAWGTVETSGLIDSEAGTVVIGTSNIDCPNFTPGAITVDAVALKLAGRAVTPSGTFSVTLRNTTLGADVETVTINVSDLHANGFGWFTIRFASSHLLLAANNYIIRCICSMAGSQVTLWRSTTGTNNMTKRIRTTTTQAPTSNHHILIANELTGQGTSNAVTMTLDNTATTTFGPSTVGIEAIVLSNNATLTLQNSASTNYYLRWRGQLNCMMGGTLNIGTSGSPVQASSTCTLEFDCANNNDSKLRRSTGGSVNIYGAPKTHLVELTATANSGQPVIVHTAASGWNVGDRLAISPTGGRTQHQAALIASVDSSTQTTLDANLTTQKLGNSDHIYARVLNLTRNVLIRSVSNSLRGNVLFTGGGTGASHLEYFEIHAQSIGSNNANNQPIDIQSTVTVEIAYAAYNNEGSANGTVFAVTGASTNNFSILNCVAYSTADGFLFLGSTTGTAYEVSGNVVLVHNNSVNCYRCGDLGGVYKNNLCIGTVANTARAFEYYESNNNTAEQNDPSLFDGNQAIYCAITGFIFGNNFNAGQYFSFAAQNLKSLRCGDNATSNVYGFDTATIAGFPHKKIFLRNCQSIGTGEGGLQIRSSVGLLRLEGCDFAGDAVGSPFASQIGIRLANNPTYTKLQMVNCRFGALGGVTVNNTTADLAIASNYGILQVFAQNCLFGASSTWSGLAVDLQRNFGDHLDSVGSFLRSQKHNQTTGNNRTIVPCGVIEQDATIHNGVAPSARLTPNTASFKLRSGPMRVPANASSGGSVGVYVRKSEAGDGAAYNGAEPRLILRANPVLGQATDAVLATAADVAGAWEQLAGTLPTAAEDGVWELYVDCDGTAGWINIDDWS